MAQQLENAVSPGPAPAPSAPSPPPHASSAAPVVSRSAAVVQLEGIARRFGAQWPLRGIQLRVEPGEGVALMGRNGSGKTTLLRILSTAIRPTRGTGRILGHDLVAEADRVRAVSGVLSHAPALYLDLTPRENLAFAQRMLGLQPDARRADAALERVGLTAFADDRVRHFSAGMTRRAALARLLLREHPLLLLDEPYASFDADGIALLNGIANEARARGAAVLVATHDPVRARAMTDRAVVIEQGVLRDVPWSVA